MRGLKAEQVIIDELAAAGIGAQATEKPAKASVAAPGPYTLVERGKAGSNGIKNLYIVDANGRTIAAVWGKPGEREATAALFVAASQKAGVNRANHSE